MHACKTSNNLRHFFDGHCIMNSFLMTSVIFIYFSNIKCNEDYFAVDKSEWIEPGSMFEGAKTSASKFTRMSTLKQSIRVNVQHNQKKLVKIVLK